VNTVLFVQFFECIDAIPELQDALFEQESNTKQERQHIQQHLFLDVQKSEEVSFDLVIQHVLVCDTLSEFMRAQTLVQNNQLDYHNVFYGNIAFHSNEVQSLQMARLETGGLKEKEFRSIKESLFQNFKVNGLVCKVLDNRMKRFNQEGDHQNQFTTQKNGACQSTEISDDKQQRQSKDNTASAALDDQVEDDHFSESSMSFSSHLESVEDETIEITNRQLPENAVTILQNVKQRECVITVDEQNVTRKSESQLAFHDVRNTAIPRISSTSNFFKFPKNFFKIPKRLNPLYVSATSKSESIEKSKDCNSNQLTKLMKTLEVVKDSNNRIQSTAKISRNETWNRKKISSNEHNKKKRQNVTQRSCKLRSRSNANMKLKKKEMKKSDQRRQVNQNSNVYEVIHYATGTVDTIYDPKTDSRGDKRKLMKTQNAVECDELLIKGLKRDEHFRDACVERTPAKKRRTM